MIVGPAHVYRPGVERTAFYGGARDRFRSCRARDLIDVRLRDTITYLRDRITTVIVIFFSSCNGRSSRAPRVPARCATDRSSLRITATTTAKQYNNIWAITITMIIYNNSYELEQHNYRLYTMSSGQLERNR